MACGNQVRAIYADEGDRKLWLAVLQLAVAGSAVFVC
jgi:hypothetical protein